ncbi:hypothetical protein HDU93_001232 [Gonapodya sp. JEL0774]|nr:hypothetical protein HDU93_001232 [Gonapodya sp. JEL0774]
MPIFTGGRAKAQEAASRRQEEKIRSSLPPTVQGFHHVSVEDTVQAFESHADNGLREDDAIARLERYGRNELFGDTGPSVFKILLDNTFNAMNFVLTIALAFSFVVRDYPVAITLVVVIVTNTAIGFAQEFKGEKTMAALRAMSSPTGRVVRKGERHIPEDFKEVIAEVPDEETDAGEPSSPDNERPGVLEEALSLKAKERKSDVREPVEEQRVAREPIDIPTGDIVIGDLVVLEEGDIVAADIRLISAVNLEIDEALLTGESLPVRKIINLPPGTATVVPVPDRKNLAFKNTTVTKGRGRGIVIGTGLNTEIGKIAKSLTTSAQADSGTKKSDKTPLQRTLDKMMYALLGIALLLGVVVFGANGFKWSNETLLYAVSVGVAIIPEGLPAVLVVVLAQGVSRMAKQKAIVRKIASLEALSKVTDICSDKTGTLTQGKMVVTQAWIGQVSYSISGRGLEPFGDIYLQGDALTKVPRADLESSDAFYRTALVTNLCKTSTLYLDEEDNRWKSTGDPTEVALDVFSRKVLQEDDPFVKSLEFMGEQPFDPSIKRMSVAYFDRAKGKVWIFVKGALERVLEMSVSCAGRDGIAPITPEFISNAQNETENLASQALRVLSFGFKVLDATAIEGESAEDLLERLGLSKRLKMEENLTFLGLIGMYDPPRNETKRSVNECIQAGITVRMATGDHITTARAIAKQVDIITTSEASDTALVVPASDFDALPAEQADTLPKLPRVLARCAPESKVTLVKALHKRGKFVAMTGDGSNGWLKMLHWAILYSYALPPSDAPALKAADIGIAMGLGGSEVTKSIASIVLTDDNFATIVAAVSEGRRIFENITKFVVHLFTGNIAEVIVLVIGLACRNKYGEAIFPMSPIQILWVNMVTSSPVALALGQEKASSDIMKRPPKSVQSGVFTTEVLMDMTIYGIAQGVLSLATFLIGIFANGASFSDSGHCNHSYDVAENCEPIFRARSAAFLTLTVLLLVHGFNCRHARKSAFKSRLHANKLLLGVFVFGLVSTVATIYIPFLNTDIFMQSRMTWEWGLVIGSVFIFQAVVEIYKAAKRRYMTIV